MQRTTIAFLGGGSITRCLVNGLIKNNFPKSSIWVSNRTPDKLVYFQEEFNVHTTPNNLEAIKQADVVVLAVKPRQIYNICQEIKETVIAKSPLVISVATGTTTSFLEQQLAPHLAIITAMPNAPAAVSAGCTGLFANPAANESQKNLAESIFRNIGLTIWLDKQSQMNAITALSGSGPAYVFLVIEAMQKAGEKLGLPADTARLLSIETVLGSAKMAIESSQPLEHLRKLVTSPGGTTERAIKTFEEGNLNELFSQAIQAAHRRASELTAELQANQS